MRRPFIRATVVAALIGGVSIAYAYSVGPPPSYTGAPAVGIFPAEGLCTACHTSFTPNDPAGTLEIDAPATYDPGATYPITVRLNFPQDAKTTPVPMWGFELTAVQASTGRGMGSFTVPAELQIKTAAFASTFRNSNRKYVEHRSEGTHEAEFGPVEWTFQWTAPPADSGDIYLFAAGNAADGSGTNQGDHIFTTVDTVHSGDTTTVAVPPRGVGGYVSALDPIYPNPFRTFCDMSYSVGKAGVVDLSVYDLQGRKAATVVHEWKEAGLHGAQWSGRLTTGAAAPNGVYFFRLRTAGQSDKVQRAMLQR